MNVGSHVVPPIDCWAVATLQRSQLPTQAPLPAGKLSELGVVRLTRCGSGCSDDPMRAMRVTLLAIVLCGAFGSVAAQVITESTPDDAALARREAAIAQERTANAVPSDQELEAAGARSGG